MAFETEKTPEIFSNAILQPVYYFRIPEVVKSRYLNSIGNKSKY